MKRNKISPVLWLFNLGVRHAKSVIQTLGLLTLFCLSAAVRAETSTTDADASKPERYQLAMAAALEMLASDNADAVEQFVDKHLSEDTLNGFSGQGRVRYVGYLRDTQRFHASLTLVSQLEVPAAQRRLRARMYSSNTEQNYILTINYSAEASFKVRSIYLDADTAQPQSSSGPLNRQQLITELAGYVDRLAARGIFSGTVLLADQQGVLYQSAKGMADLRFQMPNTLQTKFNLASMNKMFTAVSILQLVAEDKLVLDDKLVKYLDRSLFGAGNFDAITIAQLLTHTAGLGWPDFPEGTQLKLRKHADYKPLLNKIPLAEEPGSRFRYSNEGMLLLGMVIEAVSGQSYDDYVQQHIFARADMAHSGNFDLDGITPDLATGYFYSSALNSMQANWFIQGVKGTAAGGGYSTVEDLHKFAVALTGNALLPKALTEQAYSAKPALNSPNYGYGFAVRANHNGRIVGHSGDFIGVASALQLYQDKGFVLVVLANQSFASEPVMAKVDSLLSALAE